MRHGILAFVVVTTVSCSGKYTLTAHQKKYLNRYYRYNV